MGRVTDSETAMNDHRNRLQDGFMKAQCIRVRYNESISIKHTLRVGRTAPTYALSSTFPPRAGMMMTIVMTRVKHTSNYNCDWRHLRRRRCRLGAVVVGPSSSSPFVADVVVADIFPVVAPGIEETVNNKPPTQ